MKSGGMTLAAKTFPVVQPRKGPMPRATPQGKPRPGRARVKVRVLPGESSAATRSSPVSSSSRGEAKAEAAAAAATPSSMGRVVAGGSPPPEAPAAFPLSSSSAEGPAGGSGASSPALTGGRSPFRGRPLRRFLALGRGAAGNESFGAAAPAPVICLPALAPLPPSPPPLARPSAVSSSLAGGPSPPLLRGRGAALPPPGDPSNSSRSTRSVSTLALLSPISYHIPVCTFLFRNRPGPGVPSGDRSSLQHRTTSRTTSVLLAASRAK
mmetsp:Transcript_39758/g.119524  ORF Transcript_39758/g.119524 Transcript_39758/m.119524 type:complete len:267 (+) Transcript_39758:1742-2542(+)